MRSTLITFLLTLFVAISGVARAEVITVVPTNPIALDQPMQTLGLDIDADGNSDFDFFYDVYLLEPFLHMNFPTSAMQMNKIVVSGQQNPYGKDLVVAMPVGAMVSENSQFNGAVFGNGPLFAQPDFAGPDILEDSGIVFVGVRFLRNGDLHYGWIQLDADSNKITIHAYAWESTPQTPIMIGFPASVEDASEREMMVRRLRERLYQIEGEVQEVVVVDALGRKVWQGGSLIDLSGLPTGAYFIRCYPQGKAVALFIP